MSPFSILPFEDYKIVVVYPELVYKKYMLFYGTNYLVIKPN